MHEGVVHVSKEGLRAFLANNRRYQGLPLNNRLDNSFDNVLTDYLTLRTSVMTLLLTVFSHSRRLKKAAVTLDLIRGDFEIYFVCLNILDNTAFCRIVGGSVNLTIALSNFYLNHLS